MINKSPRINKSSRVNNPSRINTPTISDILLQNGTASLKDFYPLAEVKTEADKESLAAKGYAPGYTVSEWPYDPLWIRFTTAGSFSPVHIIMTRIMPRSPSP